MCRHLKKNYSNIRSKGVKQAPFYVLLGAQMPALLVETSFISNPRECKRLTSAKYQDEHLCDGIIRGIRKYIKETSPTAFKNPSGIAPWMEKTGIENCAAAEALLPSANRINQLENLQEEELTHGLRKHHF
jgi:hypothetical protein